MSQDEPDITEVRAELNAHDIERYARERMRGARRAWLTAYRLACHISAGWLAAWGCWAVAFLRPEGSSAWDTFERLGGVALSGAVLAVLGFVCCVGQIRGGRWAQRLATHLVFGGWAWIFLMLATASWTTTGTLMYGVGAMLTLAAAWLCWGREDEPSGPWPWEVPRG